MTKVFISHSRASELSALLAMALSSRNIDVWHDTALEVGGLFRSQISTALNLADVVLVLWTKESRKSRWVRLEAFEAARQNKLINVEISAYTPYPFRPFLRVDLRTAVTLDDPSFDKLITVIEAVRKGEHNNPEFRVPETLGHRSYLGMYCLYSGSALIFCFSLFGMSIIYISDAFSIYSESAMYNSIWRVIFSIILVGALISMPIYLFHFYIQCKVLFLHSRLAIANARLAYYDLKVRIRPRMPKLHEVLSPFKLNEEAFRFCFSKYDLDVVQFLASNLDGIEYESVRERHIPINVFITGMPNNPRTLIIVVWSANASADQRLRELANEAMKGGRLVLVALDDTPIPIGWYETKILRVGGPPRASGEYGESWWFPFWLRHDSYGLGGRPWDKQFRGI